MTIKVYVAVAGIALITLVSCGGNNDTDYVDKSLITSGSEKNDTVPAINPENNNAVNNTSPATIPGITPVNPGLQTNPVNITPQNNNIQFNPSPAAAPASVATTTTAPGMNPPHGEPGHRCDINVGQPLNSKPAPATAQPTTVTAQPSVVTTQPQQVTMTQPTAQKTAPGMNPPHGEPGHRCEIAVGAPLDSKPTTPAVTTTPAAPLTINPAKADTLKN